MRIVTDQSSRSIDATDGEVVEVCRLPILSLHDPMLAPLLKLGEERAEVVERHFAGDPDPLREALASEHPVPEPLVLAGRPEPEPSQGCQFPAIVKLEEQPVIARRR